MIGSGTGWHDVTCDDQRFVMARHLPPGAGNGGASSMVLVQNFFEELRQRVPN